jgi:hypothetical protein
VVVVVSVTARARPALEADLGAAADEAVVVETAAGAGVDMEDLSGDLVGAAGDCARGKGGRVERGCRRGHAIGVAADAARREKPLEFP